MADFPQVRRILYMHPAHRTVGVSGVASSFRCPVERPSADESLAAPMRVSLVSRINNAQSFAAMAAFEQVLAGNGSMECHRVDLASAEREGLANADCEGVARGVDQAVGDGHGLGGLGGEVGRARGADAVEEGGSDEDDGFETEVEIAAAARWHPVVDGVGTFIAHNRFSCFAHLPVNVTPLLVRKWAGRVFPLAWAREGNRRVFCTLLGHPEDFRRREFVRLLLNALEWVGR